MKERIDNLQNQVNTLFTNVNELYQRKQTEPPTTEQSPHSQDASRSLSASQACFQSQSPTTTPSRSRHPRFRGPTSSAFNFDVAKSHLETIGITQTEDGTQDIFAMQDVTPANTPPHKPTPWPHTLAHPDKDPLWALKREEAIRLCRVYEEEIGIMYPLLDIEKLVAHANLLFTFLEAADRTGFANRLQPGADCPSDDDTNILKVVLAATLVVEGNGQSMLGNRFFENVKRTVEMKLWEPAEIKTIKLLSLVVSLGAWTR